MNRPRHAWLALVVCLAAACSGGGATVTSPSTPPDSAASGLVPVVEESTTTSVAVAPGPDGPFAVGVRTETFVDRSRPTNENNGVPGAPTRTLLTTIFYPAEGQAGEVQKPDAPPAAAEGPFPLVMFSHGFTASGPAYGPVLEQWAAAGYVVAAPTFPLSSGAAPGGPALGDYIYQPADISFVLGEVLALDASESDPFEGLIDEERVAASGHSLGAITSIGLAYNGCCEDDRIDAYIPISGLRLPFFDDSFAYDEGAPLLLIHGEDDGTVPFSGSESLFTEAPAPKYLLRLIDGPHTPFPGPGGPVINDAVIAFLDAYLKDKPDGLERLAMVTAVEGVSQLQSQV